MRVRVYFSSPIGNVLKPDVEDCYDLVGDSVEDITVKNDRQMYVRRLEGYKNQMWSQVLED